MVSCSVRIGTPAVGGFGFAAARNRGHSSGGWGMDDRSVSRFFRKEIPLWILFCRFLSGARRMLRRRGLGFGATGAEDDSSGSRRIELFGISRGFSFVPVPDDVGLKHGTWGEERGSEG